MIDQSSKNKSILSTKWQNTDSTLSHKCIYYLTITSKVEQLLIYVYDHIICELQH